MQGVREREKYKMMRESRDIIEREMFYLENLSGIAPKLRVVKETPKGFDEIVKANLHHTNRERQEREREGEREREKEREKKMFHMSAIETIIFQERERVPCGLRDLPLLQPCRKV